MKHPLQSQLFPKVLRVVTFKALVTSCILSVSRLVRVNCNNVLSSSHLSKIRHTLARHCQDLSKIRHIYILLLMSVLKCVAV
jgi:hypothetical protein